MLILSVNLILRIVEVIGDEVTLLFVWEIADSPQSPVLAWLSDHVVPFWYQSPSSCTKVFVEITNVSVCGLILVLFVVD